MNPSARSGRKSPKFARMVKKQKLMEENKMFEELDLAELDEHVLDAFYEAHPVIPEDVSWETYYCSEG